MSVIKLPTEMLSDIFTLGTLGTDMFADAIISPLLASHVCSRWRTIAFSTPKLWRTLIMTRNSTVQLSRTIFWLSRSRRSPLRIHLDFRDQNWNWDERSHNFRYNDMENILRVLLPHLARWQHLELLCDTWEPIFTFLWHTRRRSAPSLQSIAISRCNAYFVLPGETFRPPALKRHIKLFDGDAPVLRRIALAGVHVDWTAGSLRNVTDLDLRYHAQDVMPTTAEFIAMLSSAPYLQRLTLLGWGISSAEWKECKGHVESSIVSLPQLRELRFGFLDGAYGSRVLSLLSTCSLRTLFLEDLTTSFNNLNTSAVDAAPVLSYFTRQPESFKAVEQLRLNAIQCSPDVFARFMNVFASLRDLTVDDMKGDLFSTLSANCGEDAVKCMRLRYISFRNVEINAVRCFVQSRSVSRWPLTSAVLEVRDSSLSAIKREEIGPTKFYVVPIDDSECQY